MQPEWTPIALGVVAALLVAYVVFMGVVPTLRRRRDTAPSRAKMSKAVAEGSDEKRSKPERARSLREAAQIALEELRRPRLAARYADWAHRLSPGDEEIVPLAVAAFGAARRHAALERLLWSTLAASKDARRSPALVALEKLYEKSLRRPERAAALRALAGEAIKESPRADA